MSGHRYAEAALRGDYARAGVGFMLSGAAFWASQGSGFTAWLFGTAAAIFLLFGLRTVLRHVTNYELTDDRLTRSYHLALGRTQRVLEWKSLKKLSLRFFPARRDRSQGWMELTLVGGGTRMRLDSTLGDFGAVVRAAVHAARLRRLALSDATRSNLAALGIVSSETVGGTNDTTGESQPALRP
jgi:hypothetical protein